MQPQFENIPQVMQSRPRWLLWRFQTRDGKRTKVPYQANGEFGSSTDPQKWTTFANVCAAFVRGGFDGIGFALGDGITGIDFDHAVDLTTGQIQDWATEAIEKFAARQTYIEISPSGDGFHVFILGTKPANLNNVLGGFPNRGKIELYENGRYFTVTGNAFTKSLDLATVTDEDLAAILPAEMVKVEPRQPAITDAAFADSGECPVLPDDEILRLATTADNAQTFVDLWNNQTPDVNASDGDFRLCCRLAFWTARSASQMDRLFRQSARMRPKWDSSRGDSTYGGRTICRAIAVTGEVYNSSIDLLIELVNGAGE
jgi:putative DNA primase/helicase